MTLREWKKWKERLNNPPPFYTISIFASAKKYTKILSLVEEQIFFEWRDCYSIHYYNITDYKVISDEILQISFKYQKRSYSDKMKLMISKERIITIQIHRKYIKQIH